MTERARPGGAGAAWPSVSVVVPAYNAAADLPVQLAALSQQHYDGEWEVLVVDNNSTDATAEVARGWADRLPRLRVLAATEGQGVSVARNAGLLAATGELVLVCDADDQVCPGWVAAMARALRERDHVQGALRSDGLNAPAALAGRQPLQPRLIHYLGFLPYARGANVGVRRAAALAVGGWDPAFRGGGDDVDFSWRLQLAHYTIGYAPEAVIQYRYRDNGSSLWRKHFRHGCNTPLLYRRFRGDGVRRRPLRRVLRDYAWIGLHAPTAWAGPSRSAWLRRTAMAAGRLRGSWRYRAWYP